MARFVLVIAFVWSSDFLFQAQAEEMAYLEGCKKGLSQSKLNSDHKDIEMICSDPYLLHL